MFNLKHAGTELKKVAYSEGIRAGRNNAWYKPMTDNKDGVKAIVGDDTGKEINVTVFDIESAAQFTWEEVKAGHI